MKLKIGAKAPAFSLQDGEGKTHKLADYKGRWVLLYFYPKDDTTGCTKEACMLRDNYDDFKKIKAVVLGVSKDSKKSHARFAEKYDLPFPLLSDEDLTLHKAYGTWGKKKFMGREYMGTLRTSFLINPEGKIMKIYEMVKPPIHAEEVLRDLKELRK
jgi:thioredoxin-dependent peroxiredoxin